MPFIHTKTNIKIKNSAVLAKNFGEAIQLIPGKTESRLMLSFEPEQDMYFGGKSDVPMAFVEVKLFGSSTRSAYDALTARLTEILETHLQIAPENVYVKYEEIPNWGCGGINF